MNKEATDDVMPEGEEAGTEAAQISDVQALQEEVAKYRDLALRSRADLENYRKRIVREKEDAVRYANVSLLERLLPVLDSFELGLDAARNSTDVSGILQGMEMVRKQLNDFLAEQGVKAVETEGVAFDPNVHEAMAGEPHAEVPEGHITRQIRKGYQIKDRLLRPASVMVSKGNAAE